MTEDTLIGDAVSEWIEKENPEREPDGKYHPSSVSSPCVRSAILQKRMIPQTNPPGATTKRIFMLGKIIHRMVQDAVAESGKVDLVIPEIQLGDEDVEGSADILIHRTDDDTYELIEIKSIKAIAVRYGLPKDEHVVQAGIYADYLRNSGGRTDDGQEILPLGEALTRVRFVYVIKETMEMKEQVLPVWTAIARARQRLDYVRSFEDKEVDELPIVVEGQWYRNYCSYRGSGMCCADK